MKYGKEFVQRLSVGTVDYHDIIAPALATALGSVKGKKVLDLGCGSGRYSRLFAEMGAQVTGIDRNQAQLELAMSKEQTKGPKIEYRRADIRTLEIERNTYDLALLMFVTVDVHLAEVVKEFVSVAVRALKRGGLLVIADLHPHNIGRENAFETVSIKYGKSYFDNGAEARSQTWLVDGTAVSFDPNYHYRLDFILNTLADEGFCLKKFIEPQHRAAFPTHMLVVARKEKTRWPIA